MKIVLAVLAFAACGKSSSGEQSLAESVEITCRSFAADLRRAAGSYQEYARRAADPQVPAEQLKRASGALELGIDWTVRGPVSGQLSHRLSWCLLVRAGGPARDDLMTRAAIAAQAFRQSDDPTKVADALEQLASIAGETAALPLKP